METLWTPVINYVRFNMDVVIVYLVLVFVILWFTNQFLYSTICKNITGQAKDWRSPRVIARIVWSEKFFPYFKWDVVSMIVGAVGGFLLKYVYTFIPWRSLSLCGDGFLLLCVGGMVVFPILFVQENRFVRGVMLNQLPGKQHKFLCYMRGVGFKWHIFDSRRIRGHTWKNIVFDAKCIYHDGDFNSYYLSLRLPVTYKTKLRDLEALVRDLLKDTDSRVTLASRASPSNVKQNFMQHSIPLNPDDYRENVIEPDEGSGPVVQMEDKGLKKELQEDYVKDVPETPSRGRVLRGGMRRMSDGRY